MGYIKISDPNIIDLGAWHQVINVVNQHSDTLNGLTNNFGKTNPGSTDYNAESYNHLFDAGSQQIVYGRVRVTATTGQGTNVNGAVYYGTATFAGGTTGVPAFSNTPIVTATINDGNTSNGTFTNSNDDAIISIYNVTAISFAWRIYRAKSATTTPATPITGTFYINWTAVGPK